MLHYRVQQMLVDAGFSKIGAEIAMRGPLAHLLGVDLAGRIGFGDVLSRNVAPFIGGGNGSDIIGTVPSIMWSRIEAAKKRY